LKENPESVGTKGGKKRRSKIFSDSSGAEGRSALRACGGKVKQSPEKRTHEQIQEGGKSPKNQLQKREGNFRPLEKEEVAQHAHLGGGDLWGG